MSQAYKTDDRLRLIFTLWGLLFTKCFTLEFLVRHYEVPINSITYVWTLSILMASVATAVYANLQRAQQKALVRQPGFYVYAVTGLAVVALIARSLLLTDSEASFTLPLAAAAMAIGHIWQILKHPRSTPVWAALGWFASAAALLLYDTPANFLVFAISLFLLSVTPGLIQAFQSRSKK